MRAQSYKSIIEAIILALVLAISLGITILFTTAVSSLNGTARVVNYTGIVRGATQRLVKLEISNNPNDELIRYIDEVLNGLQNSSESYNLVKVEDKVFQENLKKLDMEWNEVKSEIYRTREVGYQNTNIISNSEEHFKIADETVYSVELYAEKQASIIHKLELILIFITLSLIVYVVIKIINSYNLHSVNEELKNKAYIDLNTMLPNRSKCMELIQNRTQITKPTALILFDINNMDCINDKLGHITGDKWIHEFSLITRSSIPARHFVGRYGGDEFIAILKNISQHQVDDVMKSIDNAVYKFNKTTGEIKLGYTYGYALSTDNAGCNLETLLRKADSDMKLKKKKNN